MSAWKERGLRRLAGVAAEIVAEALCPPAADTMTFVPPDADRALRRGHHPAEALARELARCWEVDVRALIFRQRSTERQAGLPLAERRRNVAGAFAASGRVEQRLVVVDDVYTSGATASAAASALRRAGARHVEVVTFARAVR